MLSKLSDTSSRTNKIGSHSKTRFSRSHQTGTTLVEFSLVASVFFLVFFTIVDLSIYNYVKLTMQNAVREGARYAVTGRSDLDPDGNGNREAAVTRMISDASNGYLDRVMNEHEGLRVEDIDGNSVSGFGSAGEIIAIHLDCEWTTVSPLIYPFVDDGKYSFTVSTAMRNESF
ncbi:pilus assembly protein [Vibrio tubiashii]|uniref:TadE/TadG family type IV pilus assembly protein n=1 Tax=Vibrio tubiashii TaxID=29498 RepID=UPI001EFCE065|nr:TadE family protein [Vibrio tubiashii]MCG9580198.1 pilus assembly protein [Vibrio tubiashii]MCG9613789.1 pilus assembly protein [Vibrio tubiashii]MCG9688241.1 pilus assembly protein [Vibrio tubiashii]